MRLDTRPNAGRRGLTRIDVATLLGIGLVLVVVSLPRLRVLAREDNQKDAFAIALSLHRSLAEHPELAPRLARGGSLELLVAESPVLGKRLEDLELLDGGRRLRCHGYLFDMVSLEAPDPATGPDALAVRAWPWHPERTGRVAYLVTPAGEVLENANLDGRFGGPERPPLPRLDGSRAGDAASSAPGFQGTRESGWRSVRLDPARPGPSQLIDSAL